MRDITTVWWTPATLTEHRTGIAGDKRHQWLNLQDHPAWGDLMLLLANELHQLRDELELADSDRTRGRIAAIREIIALPQQAESAAMKALDEYTGELHASQ